MNWSVALAAATTLVFWASAFAAIRHALKHGYGFGELTLGRFLIASIVLLVVSAVRRVPTPPRGEWKWLALVGFIGVPCYHLSLNFGARTVDGGTVAMIISTAPVYTAVLAVLFLRERLKPLGWLGIAISCCGAMTIAIGKGGHVQIETGTVVILVAAGLSALWAVIQRPVARRIGATAVTTYTTCFGTILLLPFLPSLSKSLSTASPGATLAIIYLGIFPAAIANTLWSFCLSRMPASRLAVFMYLMPPMAILFAWLFQKEVPRPIALAGGAVAILGVIIVNRTKGDTAAKVAQQSVPSPASGAVD
jgi:drug/metabolite transporter (DMT)-like permease